MSVINEVNVSTKNLALHILDFIDSEDANNARNFFHDRDINIHMTLCELVSVRCIMIIHNVNDKYFESMISAIRIHCPFLSFTTTIQGT